MPVKKRFSFMLVMLLLILFIPACAAVSTEQQPQTGLFFMQTIDEDDLRAINLLIMSDVGINDSAAAIIIAFGGDISVGAPFDGIILTLFTKTVSTHKVKYGIIDIKYFALPFDLVVGLMLLAIFREFMEQTSAYLDKNRSSAAKFGVYGYIMAILLEGVFFISVAGAPIAALGLLALVIITLLGHIPASVVLGYSLCKRLKRYNIYMLFVVGSVIIGFFKMLPSVGGVLTFFIMPAASLGAFSVYVIHKYFYRSYVRRDFEANYAFNREKMKEIILKSVDRGE